MLLPFPRKRRIRAHVIADLSVNHLERFIYAAGYTAERFRHDYGYDLMMATFDASGYLEPGQVLAVLLPHELVDRRDRTLDKIEHPDGTIGP